ncbi:MAG: zinc metalloprotease HtpX [Candidatus Staskawiczbacteria bacterium RIFCSPLOWO2_01_FULL_40_39]|uniref:Protease HtpX homolog n=1 Tax=Candidatus Staskawiczbacteria bacterium RIFCSPHIGHO2_01_FULL_39_25 TaxID=1802202 RepID=A0A1G2HMU3_9BACT|nr:MAG: zinc metalloprotease HtpX [Candidatus Staskawiczbacteria bacterium RIFCSPHIGHO2_01_FULL_39_25]OGZ73264.1 MAG: zinc metalloprotease HtpX [Candidatus Staskawiczbacteria bacterium RIFCSPLOWO2_01_FULL_40_39]OGZ74751.1 MAG: zinc metalloprotease HtpX [Candidatus Staskawiczbacteria bacterium RIFCSPLOWO2_02_FULL_39_8]
MASIYKNADKNTRKTWLFLTLFLVFIIAVGWLFSYLLNSSFILYVAVFLSVAMSITSYWFSDKIVLSMAHAKPIEKSDNPELYRIVENLAITAGLPLPKIYIIYERQLNAFATGRDKNHAVVAVTQGLLEKLERSELEGVIAHELSHIGNKDMLLSTVIVIFAGIVALLSDFFLRISFWGGGRRDSDNNKAGALLMVLGIAAAILAPLAASLIRLAISRKREFLADADGALLTRYPEGLASALEKIATDVTPMRSAHAATAHLYIDSPFNEKQSHNWFVKIFQTHPPVEERIKALRDMNI